MRRLSTINEEADKRFQKATDTAEAERLFRRIFQAYARRIEARWFALLENAELAEHLTAGALAHGFDFDALNAEMDSKYFGTEDEGRADESVANFGLARLMSALSFAAVATDPADFSEASYEAIMALPNPKENSATLL